MFIYTVGWHF